MPYRGIWEEVNGPIPRDENDRAYEIHHINGDHSDNRIENLQCVRIEEHFQIHLDQGDMRAAAAIARRMFMDKAAQTDLNRLAGLEAHRKGTGIHAIPEDERRENSSRGGKAHKGLLWWTNGELNAKVKVSPGPDWKMGRTVSGTGPKVGSILGVFWNNGTENKRSIECPGPEWKRGKFLTPEQRRRRSEITFGRKQTATANNKRSDKLKGRPQPKIECPHCNKSGGAGAMTRFHFDRCKENG
ncbi:hypothetical protein D3C87_583600 [compost metagenome]